MVHLIYPVFLCVALYVITKHKLLWAVIKNIFAVAISPLLVLLFLVSKKAFLPVFTALWVHLDIMSATKGLYLRRFFMTPKTKWFHPRFLHYIRLSDTGRDPHDHPGKFDTTILAGGYDEKVFHPKVNRPVDMIYARPGDTLHNPEGHTHMVTLIEPTWSWVKAWIRGKPWGFWKLDAEDPSKDVWVESNEYGAKGIEIKSWE